MRLINTFQEEKEMKKKFVALLLTASLVVPFTPVYADAKDDRIAELEVKVADLQKQLDEALAKLPSSTNQSEYKIGETWVVEGQWKLTVDSVEEVQERNEFSDKQPQAVYIINYTYENLGYEDDIMDGLYIDMENSIIDSAGKMGYSYPGDITFFPQETPVGATCQAQACIGVDSPGGFKVNVSEYDGNGTEQSAVFSLEF